MKKKDTMKMRREWVNEVLDTLDDLEEKAETNGESRLMYEIMKVVKENIEIKEQGGNALFLLGGLWSVATARSSIIPPLRKFVKCFLQKKLFFIFPKMLDYFRGVW